MVETLQNHRQIRTIKHESFDTVINYTNKELRERASRRAKLVTVFKTPSGMSQIWVSIIEYDETQQEYLDRKAKYEKIKAEKQVAVSTTTTKPEPVKAKEKQKEVKEESTAVDVEDIDMTEDI
jgi:hypothetical protein